jgi:uncharacterized membrane protein YgdD (TMEM256/DUF423 family)
MSEAKTWILIGALCGATGVAAGAYGAHGLDEQLADSSSYDFEKQKSDWETAARYHLIHAVAVVAVGLASARFYSRWLAVAGGLFVAGTLLFSGTLYFIVLTSTTGLGHAVMVGGLAYLAGWLSLAVAAVRGCECK